MKILSVGCLNLNSLRGQHQLDFRKGALADCGLFAITGPTGAGKTTLLDAITLALYGRTPRQEKNGAALMTHGTGEAWAEVVFEVERQPDGQPGPPQRYLARWHQRRARSRADGALQDPGMDVSFQPGGKPIAQKKREAEAVLVTLTGLTYDQFTRSVLLAQGGFAQFLKASANERAELLERMTGTDHYRTLSMASFQAWKNEQEKEQTLRAQLGGVSLLPPDERVGLEADLAASEAAVLTAQQEEATLTAAVRWHETLTRLATDLAATATRLADAQTALATFAPEAARLTRHERVAPFAPAWAGIQDAAARAEALARELTVLDATIARQTTDEAEAKTQLTAAEAAVQVSKAATDAVQPTLQAASKEHSALDELRKSVAELHTQHTGLVRQQTAADDALAAAQQQSAAERAEHHRLGGWLAQHQAASEIPVALTDLTQYLADWQQSRRDYQRTADEQRRALDEHKRAAEEAERHQTRLAELTALTQRAGADLRQAVATQAGLRAVTTDRFATARQKLTTAKERLREQDELLLAKKLIASHADARRDLKAGDPCPLCGAVEHPFATDLDVSDDALAVLRRARDEQATRAESWHQEVQRLEQVLLALGDAIASSEEITPLLPDPATPAADLLTRAQAVAGPRQTLPVQLRGYATETEQTTGLAATAATRARERQAAAAALGEELAELVAAGKVAREAVESVALTWQVPFLESTPEKLPAALRTRFADFEENQRQHRALDKAVADHDARLTQARATLARLTEETRVQQVRWQDRGAELDARAAANARHYVGFATPDEALAAQLAALRAAEQLANQRNDLYLTAGQARKESDVQRKEKAQAHQRTVADHAARFAALTADWRAADLAPADPAALADWLLPEPERLRLDAERQRRQQAVASLTEKLADLRREQQTELAYVLTSADAPTVAAEHAAARLHHHALLETRAQQRARLQQDDANRATHATRADALTAQAAETLRWKELTDLIGSREGDKFARFAQSLTLARLTQLANQHLRYLCARYRLRRHPDADRPLDLLVVDRYQADATREVSTLSGGESFLVSLALALGLSELASNTARLDSLFIDEGFGTLDAETLDVALDALENLQARGKTIGIISHVESLKDRIPVQVVVEKGASGFSTLRVLPEVKEAVRRAVVEVH